MPCHQAKRLAVLPVRLRQSPAFRTNGQEHLGPRWRLLTYRQDHLGDPENKILNLQSLFPSKKALIVYGKETFVSDTVL